MNSVLQKLEQFSLLHGEIWYYLSIKDICKILILDKSHRSLFLVINRSFSHNISLYRIFRHNINDKCKILINMLKSFPNIYSLNLGLKFVTNNRNDVMDIESMSILYNTKSICNSLRKLRVVISDSGVVGISNLKYLSVLSINYSSITNQGILEISTMINITSLKTSTCINISEDGFYCLKNLSNLVVLNISCCSLSDRVLNHLSSLTKLIYLNLCSSSNINDNGVMHLSNLISLEYLNLSDSRITNLYFLTPLQKITSLNLSCCSFLQDNSDFSSISYLTNMTLLDLSSCHLLADISINYLKNLTNLTSLNLEGLSMLTSLSHLDLLVNLEYLNLLCCSWIPDNEMITISYLTKLKDLYLEECDELSDVAYLYLMSLDHIRVLSKDKRFNFYTK